MTQPLPNWVLYINALALPTIAIVGTLIAAGQMYVAQQKLRYDEFYRQYDKRFAIYEATRKILARVFDDQLDLSEDELRIYGLCVLDARFLFNDEMAAFLRQMHQRIAAWREADWMVNNSERRGADYEGIRRENLDWIREQGSPGSMFSTAFDPFLRKQEFRLPRWLRWLG
jgi:hypothetical protein